VPIGKVTDIGAAGATNRVAYRPCSRSGSGRAPERLQL